MRMGILLRWKKPDLTFGWMDPSLLPCLVPCQSNLTPSTLTVVILLWSARRRSRHVTHSILSGKWTSSLSLLNLRNLTVHVYGLHITSVGAITFTGHCWNSVQAPHKFIQLQACVPILHLASDMGPSLSYLRGRKKLGRTRRETDARTNNE